MPTRAMTCFDSRAHAGQLLAEQLAAVAWKDPVVLAIPRGGLEVGVEIARRLGAELDVVLARKLRCPFQSELAIGAVSEAGEVMLQHCPEVLGRISARQIERERQHQYAEMARRRQLYRQVRPQAPLAGRSVILTDDGIATGSTMLAALQSVHAAGPLETIVAVPVGSPERVAEVARGCDRMICLREPDDFRAVGQYYRSFEQVSDERVVSLLKAAADEHASRGQLTHRA